jgi:hypothetical protein
MWVALLLVLGVTTDLKDPFAAPSPRAVFRELKDPFAAAATGAMSGLKDPFAMVWEGPLDLKDPFGPGQ